MCHDPAVNPLDAVAIALLVIAVILGVRSGALPQVLGLIGAAIAALAGLAILPAVTPLLDSCLRRSGRSSCCPSCWA